MTSPATKILLALLTVATMSGAASAQSRVYFGRSSTDSSGATTNYDSRGEVITRESTTGNTTTVYDAGGRNVGRVTNR